MKRIVRISRRNFLGCCVATGALVVPDNLRAESGSKLIESARELPVAGEFDVIVAGGGPAGISAAVAAARAGKRTALFETHGCLGGIWTAGLVGCMLDFDKCWTSGEIIRRLDAVGAKHRADRNGFHYEPEYMKVICESRYPVDIHALDAESGRRQAADTESVEWKPFQIPLRALRAKDLDNLWMAGRCLSGDPIAHASYRVTGSAVATGEAAGRAAAGYEL